MNPDDEYRGWLKERREVSPAADLTDRIMTAVEAASRDPAPVTNLTRPAGRFERAGFVLLWTAASLVFVARIAALVGNLVFPTSGYPEFAADQRLEEPHDEHRNAARS